jgi:hypothetical protein
LKTARAAAIGLGRVARLVGILRRSSWLASLV